MSLADGEYDIDVSQLFDTILPVNDHENIAMRYGFIPDSMDQRKPLTLYQNSLECVLRADSVDGKPILFEGIPQRHREGQPNDAYYLTFMPLDSKRIHLRRLNLTIRFSKSRNVTQLQQKMDTWEKQKKESDAKNEKERIKAVSKETQERSKKSETIDKNPERSPEKLPKVDKSPKLEKSQLGEKPKQSTSTRIHPSKPTTAPFLKLSRPSSLGKSSPALSSRNSTPSSKYSPADRSPKKTVPRPRTVSSKRAPANSTPREENIISESDFDDLHDYDMDERGQQFEEYERLNKPKPIVERADDMDMDDDFKDLEDQLQEVLGEDEDDKKAIEPTTTSRTRGDGKNDKDGIDRKNKKNDKEDKKEESSSLSVPKNTFGSVGSDSDESDGDDYHYSGLGINIRVDEGPSSEPKVYRNSFSVGGSQRPTSLRDYVQDESSEEE